MSIKGLSSQKINSRNIIMQNNEKYGIKPITDKMKAVDIVHNYPIPPLQHDIIPVCVFLVAITSFSGIASTKDGEYGLLEGKWAGMLHPIYFFVLFGVSVSAAYHGLRWRRARELTADIARIKSNEFSPQIFEMRSERDEILKSDPKNKHISLGSIILGSGTAMALEGALSTYFRSGELFPDYHLFGGLGLVCIWASSYTLAPFTTRGNDWVRNTHVTLMQSAYYYLPFK
jgi:hypothetical protein